MGACSAKEKGAATATVGGWELSNEAQATYYYLLLEEARKEDNATLGEEAILKLLEIDDSPAVFLEGANFFWQMGDAAKTRLLVEEGQARHPDNLQLQLLLSQLYITEQRYEEAQELLQEYLTRNPDDTVARTELASMLVQGEQYADALAMLDKIPKGTAPQDTTYLRAKALGGLGRYDEAIPLLKAILKEDPEFLEAWADLAFIYETTNDFKGAEETYQSIMLLGDPTRELILRLAEVNVKLGKYDTAIKLLDRAPQDLATFMPVVGFLLDARAYNHAETLIDSVLKEHPEYEELWFHKAVLYYDGYKDSARALEALQLISTDNRFHERSLRFSIHLLFEADRKDEALALAKSSRQQYLDVNEFWLLEARLLQDLGRTDDAIALLQETKERWSEDPEVYYTYGLVLDRAGRKDDAFTVMDELLELEPDNADALNYVGYTLADQGKELLRALDLITQALEIKPDNDYIMDSLAWVQFKLGRLEDAWASINKAVVTPEGNQLEDPEIWDHYGDIAKALGKLDEARKGYENAIKFGHKKPDAVRAKLEAL